MMVGVSMELLESLSIVYEQSEETEALAHLIATKLFIPYIVLQFLVLSLIPFFMLAATALFKLSQRTTHLLIWLSSTMLLGQVLLMRWNVVVGGQLLSKSMRGFTSYFPGVWEKEGILTAAVIFTMPFLILYVFHRLVPLFPDAEKIRK